MQYLLSAKKRNGSALNLIFSTIPHSCSMLGGKISQMFCLAIKRKQCYFNFKQSRFPERIWLQPQSRMSVMLTTLPPAQAAHSPWSLRAPPGDRFIQRRFTVQVEKGNDWVHWDWAHKSNSTKGVTGQGAKDDQQETKESQHQHHLQASDSLAC